MFLVLSLSLFLVVETTFHTLEIDVADLSQFLSLVFIWSYHKLWLPWLILSYVTQL